MQSNSILKIPWLGAWFRNFHTEIGDLKVILLCYFIWVFLFICLSTRDEIWRVLTFRKERLAVLGYPSFIQNLDVTISEAFIDSVHHTQFEHNMDCFFLTMSYIMDF